MRECGFSLTRIFPTEILTEIDRLTQPNTAKITLDNLQ